MTLDKTVSKKVKFSDGLPLGTRGTFTHDGEKWIAIPMVKYTRICAVMDRLIGIHSKTAENMIRWLNFYPGDAERAAKILEMVALAHGLARESALEKADAVTS